MRFSGHETFVCKQSWLRKGYNFLNNQKKFSSDSAVIDLGVGKNMVSSIAYWMKSFNLCDDKWELTSVAHYIFDDKGKDPYLEDLGTLWLLHYYLIKNNYASIYNLFFNGFRKKHSLAFSENQLHEYLKKEAELIGLYNQKTIDNDISVFRRMYIEPKIEEGDIEDVYSSIFSELALLTKASIDEKNKKELGYNITYETRNNLASEIVLFTILDQFQYKDSISINFNDLIGGYNSPGLIFSLSREGLMLIIDDLLLKYPSITYSSTAGLQILQISEQLSKWTVLNNYYDK